MILLIATNAMTIIIAAITTHTMCYIYIYIYTSVCGWPRSRVDKATRQMGISITCILSLQTIVVLHCIICYYTHVIIIINITQSLHIGWPRRTVDEATRQRGHGIRRASIVVEHSWRADKKKYIYIYIYTHGLT